MHWRTSFSQKVKCLFSAQRFWYHCEKSLYGAQIDYKRSSPVNLGAIFALLSLVGDQNIHRDLRQAGKLLYLWMSLKASSINCIWGYFNLLLKIKEGLCSKLLTEVVTYQWKHIISTGVISIKNKITELYAGNELFGSKERLIPLTDLTLDEKNRVKTGLLEVLLNENDNSIKGLLAECIKSVAEIDYPERWRLHGDNDDIAEWLYSTTCVLWVILQHAIIWLLVIII